jgi:membrane-bound lytic murein transglycosylase D
MEKPVSMNLFKIACLSALLWLTGCATTEPLDAPNTPTSATTAPAATPYNASAADTQRQAPSPGRPLRPITAGTTRTTNVAELAPPADLWERIRRGYGMPDLQNELVSDREQWYSTRPDYILRMTERSRKYLFHVVEELELRNMPTELALLPFIESAFNPQAVSSVKATGMWQFMPATGRDFDLRQNVFRDDRRDVLASTRAALDYLQKLYGMFGDWHLALAAYNWGQGSVSRAIAKNQRLGLGTSYTELSMPMETRMYVPKLQAVKNIVASPETFNSRLPHIENHPYFQMVAINRDIDVALAAKLAGISLDDFKALNPSVHRPVILAAGASHILLPWDNAAKFQANLESYGAGQLASWTVWVAPTTLKPADVARRVGMSETELRNINSIPPRVVVKAGSSLLVPRSARMETDVAEHVADNGQLSLAPEIILRRTTLKAGKRDSVASVAKRFQVSKESLADWNKVSTTAAFKPGQSVVVFLPPSTRASTSKAQPNRAQANATRSKTAPAKATRLAKK